MNDKLQTFSLNFSRYANRDVAPLRAVTRDVCYGWTIGKEFSRANINQSETYGFRCSYVIDMSFWVEIQTSGWKEFRAWQEALNQTALVYAFLCLLSICWWPQSCCLYQSNLFLFVFSLTVRERESMLVWTRITMDPMMANPRTWTICLVTLWVGRDRAGEWQIHMSWSGGNAIHFYNVKVTQPIFLI